MRYVLTAILVAVATSAHCQTVDATTDCFSLANQSSRYEEGRDKFIQCEMRKHDLTSSDPDRRECAGRFPDHHDTDSCANAKAMERRNTQDALRADPNYPYGDWNIGSGSGDPINTIASSEGELSGKLNLRCDAQGGFQMSVLASDPMKDKLFVPAFLILPGHAPRPISAHQSRLLSGIIDIPAAEPIEDAVLSASKFSIRLEDQFGAPLTYTFTVRTPAAARKKILESCPIAP